MIKPCADELYFQFDDDTVDSWGCYGVSFTLLSLNVVVFFLFFLVFLPVTHHLIFH